MTTGTSLLCSIIDSLAISLKVQILYTFIHAQHIHAWVQYSSK